MKVQRILTLSYFLASLSSAAPSNPLDDRGLKCDAPNFLKKIADLASCKTVDQGCSRKAASATQFCSVFLGPRSTTVTVTSTTYSTDTVVTTVDTTSLVYSTTTATTVVTSTAPAVTVPVTSFTTNAGLTVTAATKTIYQRRAAEPRDNDNDDPTELIASCPADIVSSACSQIYTPTTTTITASTTQTIGQTDTNTATNTIFTTVVTTIVQTNVVSATPIVTSTETVTIAASTVTPIVVKPKICNAAGIFGPNSNNYRANFNTNQADCISSCKTDDRCLSTGFYIVTQPGGSSTGTCRYYDKPVADSAELGSGYYNWNDKAC